jgi:methyltransferase (TIGR00027 family)
VQKDTPSFTARWVAAMRGVGAYLPPRLRLVDDPYGFRFSPRLGALAGVPSIERRARATAPLWMRGYLWRFALYMQLRTRVIDDDVSAFAAGGDGRPPGRQLVLLGAGFDCRAWRLAALSGATVYEVDHPATQARKRAIMGDVPTRGRVVFVPWDFEDEPLSALPARLKQEGHDSAAPTMSVLEGVVMYLSAPALDATFACVAEYSAPGSPLAVTYMESELMRPGPAAWISRRAVVRLVGEPFRSAFDPAKFADWLSARGFQLERDESATQSAMRLLAMDARRAARLRRTLSHFALARRA